MDDDRILDAALALAGARGWRQASLREIAAAAGCGLAEVYRRFPSRTAFAEALIARADAAMLAADEPEEGEAEESAHDRLFDLLMRRFDALGPHRDAVAALWRDALRHPPAAACLLPALARSMARMLEAAGVPPRPPCGPLRVKLLAGIHLSAMRIWLEDDSQDQARTMARLDKALRRWAPVLQGGAR